MQRNRKYWEKHLGQQWTQILKDILRTEYMNKVMDFVNQEYALSEVFPLNYDSLFENFRVCSWDRLKVVIIGEEPSRLTGTSSLAFGDSLIHSWSNPSLIKIRECIFREFYEENEYVYFMTTFDQTLKSWAEQGVLLLNQSLTARIEESGTHKRPWNKFIIHLIQQINQYKPGTIFILLGDKSKESFYPYLEKLQHVYNWEHPYQAELEKREWNCPNFKQANQMLEYLYGKEEIIKW